MHIRILVIRIRMGMDWNHLRTFEAVVRAGSLTEASRLLDVSQSTVSRHLQQLEDRAGTPLWVRGSPFALTPRGRALHDAMAPMVGGALAAGTALDLTDEVAGEVTITTVRELVRWLVPELGALYRRHPRLQLQILAENRIHSLAAEEADIAIR
ncbi:MAG: LysR family transcriptional regulator, partial [Myxococcota bacterium]